MPEIRTLAPGDQDALEAFLRPRVESSIFLLSNSRQAGLIDRGERLEGTYFAAFEGRRIAGVVAHYWLGNLIFQAPAHLRALVDAAVAAEVRPIGGLLGPSEQVQRAREVLDWTDAELQLDEEEGLYALDLAEMVLPEPLRSGRLHGRRMERRDLDRVAEWRVGYHLEALGAEETPELRAECRVEIESSFEQGLTWVLEDGGELVASTSFNATIAEAVQVGGVWTPPALRGRGYGRVVVAVSLLDARAEGVERSILFTGDDNVPARRAYDALGYRRIGDHRIVLRR